MVAQMAREGSSDGLDSRSGFAYIVYVSSSAFSINAFADY